MHQTRQQASQDAFDRNPYGTHIATVRMASGYVGVCLNSQQECQNWINFNRDWLHLGSEKIERAISII